ncbi:MAG: phosphotransferase [Rubrobacter sp.]
MWVDYAEESYLRSGLCELAFDPHFRTLVRLIPDEMRPHLTGLTGAVSYSTSRSHSVFRLVGERGGDVYLKVLGVGGAEYDSLRDEAVRLEWLKSRLPVPKVVASGSRGGYEFLLTKAVSGVPAHDRSAGWNRREVAALVGKALKRFHSVPVVDCPFRHPIVGPASKEDEVLVHGDYCLPNVLFDADGCHYLDVGEAGVGDRYVDIVAGIWSLRHNYGKGSVKTMLNEYGLQALDRGKLTAYWRWWNSL